MLELKTYTFAEMSQILNGPNNKQGIIRKLERYGVLVETTGTGTSLTFNVKSIADPFKVFCITELGIYAGTDFTKLRTFYYYLFCSEGFAEKPLVEMERIMRADKKPISRQTISKSISYLEKNEYIHLDRTSFTYYAIFKASGKKHYKIITQEDYSEGWRIYWAVRNEYGYESAYRSMYGYIGGHPYKKPKIEQNQFYTKDILRLIDMINEAFLE